MVDNCGTDGKKPDDLVGCGREFTQGERCVTFNHGGCNGDVIDIETDLTRRVAGLWFCGDLCYKEDGKPAFVCGGCVILCQAWLRRHGYIW